MLLQAFPKRECSLCTLPPQGEELTNEPQSQNALSNAAQEHIQTSSHSVSEASLKASFSEAPSARTLDVVSGRAPSSLKVLALLVFSSS